MSSEISSLPESKLKEFHIKLLRSIQNDSTKLNLSRLSEIIDRAPSTTSEHLNKLVKNEYLVKHNDGYNNWYELRERGRNFLQTMNACSEMLDRSHGLMLTFQIKRRPSNGFCEEDFIVNDGMKNWSTRLRKNISSNLVIYVNDKSSISIGIREVWARKSEHAVIIAYFIAEDVIRELMQEYPKLVVGRDGKGCMYPCRISKQSHAIQKDLFAKKSAEFNLHISNSDTEGVFEVDQSHGVPEIEFVDPDNAAELFKKYESFLSSLLDDAISVEALEHVSSLYDRIQEKSKNQDTKKGSSNTERK